MCDTSRSRTTTMTLTLGGVYDQQQHPEHETSSGEPALMGLERGHRAWKGWDGPPPVQGKGRWSLIPRS
jgi:hypothetical protein